MSIQNNEVSLFDLSISNEIEEKYYKGIKNIVKNNDFVLGKDVELFENLFSNFIGNKYTYGLNSGTDSLEIALRALGVGVGDEVIVPSFSFFATSEVVLRIGAQPIYCDINLTDLTLNIKDIENLISNKTKAIIAVHLFGNSADMTILKKLIKNTDIKIIEDVAQAFGSKHKNKYLGKIGEFGCFSFYPTKNLNCFGDGGAITFNNKKYSNKIKSLRNHGSTKPYYHKYIGLNSRLDTIQALILTIKLSEIKSKLNLRIKNNNLYSKKLNSENVNIHSQKDQPLNVFPITINNPSKYKKTKLSLKKNNIQFGSYYPFGLYEFPESKLIQNNKGFKNTDFVKNNIITLPCHPKLSINNIDKIINIINEI
tara:strand:- start:75 stop:1178 length:1104 start_codon:yes stop_codon:yes gene_type:complete